MKALRTFAGIFGVLAIIAVVAYAYVQGQSSNAWNHQKWGNVADAPHVVSLKPGQWMRFGPMSATVGSFRYDVNSSLPINTGMVPLNGAWTGNATCYETQVFSSVKSCGVQPASENYIFIADTRSAGDIFAGAILGNKGVTQENRVSITTYHWGCVADCVK